MEMGFDAVMVTAIASAGSFDDGPRAFKEAIKAGREHILVRQARLRKTTPCRQPDQSAISADARLRPYNPSHGSAISAQKPADSQHIV